MRWLAWLAALVAVLAATMLPLSDFKGHSHWAQVVWIPFDEPRIDTMDVVANVLLFVPVGFFFPFPSSPGPARARRTALRPVLFGLALSSSVEFYQVFCHGHVASMTDVLTNTLGTWAGARLWLAVRPRRPGD